MARLGSTTWSRWFGWGCGANRAAALTDQIAVGDRFFESRPPHAVWTVDRYLATPYCDIPHVIISRGGIAPTTKIISTAVLRDVRFFRRDRRSEAGEGGDTGQRRRKEDLPRA